MYGYLLATLSVVALDGIIFWLRKDLRRPVIWGGVIYTALIIPLAFILILLGKISDITWQVIPDYWNPDTLFNLGRVTGIVSIEDVLFTLGIGGLAAVIYEVVSPHRIKNTKKHHHIISLIIFPVVSIAGAYIFSWNIIYNLILASLIGWGVIAVQRKDLILASISGAGVFFTIYIIALFLYEKIFGPVPWTLESLSGVMVFSYPIEELLFALSLGLMWTPIYEYVFGKSIK
ncbi:hypothetical protein CL629_03680 [bacterium]|nr:hypothetical protein [bacterium]|tara:strand:+ start:1971 stop:2666 length:696 start_codon:yes stop_codon:yes gene_type:complete